MPAPEITVVGSANLDLVVDVDHIPLVGETVLGGDLRQIPGGKGANQAVAAARLGRRVAMLGRVGDDDAGATLRAALDGDGVDTKNLTTTAQTPSGAAMIAVGSNGDNAIVVSPGANGRVTPSDITAAGQLVTDAAVVLLQLEVPVEAVVAAAVAATGTVILNPAPAPIESLPGALLSAVDIVVPNETELASLTGHEGPVHDDPPHEGSVPEGVVDVAAAEALARQLPCRAVVVTLGSAGALVVENQQATHIDAPRVDAVDTTAAGDSFCGALADALVRGETLLDAARWAVRVGAATTQRRGAQPSLPTPDEVETLLA